MKKIFTLLTFVFLANGLLFGQCPDAATPNPTNKTFNMNYNLEADRDAAWNALDSIIFPAGAGAPGGGLTVTVAKADLTIDGPVGADNVYRIRAVTSTEDYFGGENANFEGSLIFHMSDGSSVTCDYEVAVGYAIIDVGTPIEMFPNPVKDQSTLINAKGKAIIYNVLGQAVKHLTIDTDQATIKLDNLLNGQYYLQVIREDGTIVMKQFSKTN